MRILWFAHSANPAYAGVRLRCILPSVALRQAGHSVTVDPVGAAQPADAAVVQGKWLLDCSTAQAMQPRLDTLQRLREQGCRLVLDCFDNYFLNEGNDAGRAELLRCFRSAFTLFDAFSVSSPGLVPFFKSELGEAARLQVIGDPLEGPGSHRCYESPVRRANPKRWPAGLRAFARRASVRWQRRSTRQLLWFGNHGSKYALGGMGELARIVEPLTSASKQVPLHLVVVSNSRARYQEILGGAPFSHSYVEWDRLHFAAFLQAHDLVVLPTSLTPFTVAKSNNRLLLPLSLGVPVMADALPDYLPWQAHFQLGGWNDLSSTLSNLDPLRARARSARGPIELQYSLPAIGAAWLRLLEESVESARA